MDFPVQINACTIEIGLSIMYFEVFQIEMSSNYSLNPLSFNYTSAKL